MLSDLVIEIGVLLATSTCGYVYLFGMPKSKKKKSGSDSSQTH